MSLQKQHQQWHGYQLQISYLNKLPGQRWHVGEWQHQRQMFQRWCWWSKGSKWQAWSISCGSGITLPMEGGNDGFTPVNVQGRHSRCCTYSLKISPQACAGQEIRGTMDFILPSRSPLLYGIVFKLNSYPGKMIEKFCFVLSQFKALLLNRTKITK